MCKSQYFGGVLVTIPRPNKVSGSLNNCDDTTNSTNDTGNTNDDTTNSVDAKSLLLEIISREEGLTAPILAEKIGKSLSTTKRYIKELSDKIEFRGATKNGGYYIK